MPKKAYRPSFYFDAAPTIGQFITDSESLFRVVIGPVGSGKTTGMCCEVMRIADMQLCYPGDAYKRARIAIIRNTTPELKTTTINTWKDWFPEEACGPIVWSSPIKHKIIRRPQGRPGDPDFKPGLNLEVLFLALDKPKDVKKLRSLELTAAYINEISEVPYQILNMLKRRVGRYPAAREIDGRKYEAVRACVIADSNAMDEDHWLFKLKEEQPVGWTFFVQPPAILEVEDHTKIKVRCVEPDPRYRAKLFHVEQVIKAAGRLWVVNPEAENIKYLRTNYYYDQVSGSDLPSIRRDLQAKFVYVQDGRPVVSNYHDETFAVDDLPLLKDRDLLAGLDVGGGTLNPACILAQRSRRGTWLLHAEIVPDEMGVENFHRAIRQALPEIAPGFEIAKAYADPACIKRDELYEVQIKDFLSAKGIPVMEAPTNDIRARIDAWHMVFNRFIDGRPGVLINKKRCPRLRRGLAGGWFFKRMQVAGEERYRDMPIKNEYSHPCDAGGYLLLGGGEYVAARYGKKAEEIKTETVIAEVNFDPFHS